jgi:hypothetical protein
LRLPISLFDHCKLKLLPPVLSLARRPPWDPLRQTPEQWKQTATAACKARIDETYGEILDYYQQAIQSGELREFPRPRQATGAEGQDKLPIASESTRYTWAVTGATPLIVIGHPARSVMCKIEPRRIQRCAADSEKRVVTPGVLALPRIDRNSGQLFPSAMTSLNTHLPS